MNKSFRAIFSDSFSGNPIEAARTKIQNLKWPKLVAIFLAFALFGAVAEGQQQTTVPRIGFLVIGSASDPRTLLRLEAFRQGLRDLGYIEGKTITVEHRSAEGKSDRLPELAEELVRFNVAVLVVGNDTTARAAQKLTKSIPIVMASSGNPIGSGVIASLARPGGNVTGLTSYSPELLGKRLGLLKEVLPKVSRFAFLNSASKTEVGASITAFRDAQVTAKTLGIIFRLVEVSPVNPDIDAAFRVMTKERIGALVTSPIQTIVFNQKKILELAEKNRLPAMHPDLDWTNSGGLLSYGPNAIEQFHRAAVFVDKILKGTRPADLPVEAPIKFEFVINLKTAKTLNLTIPQSVLFRADRVIR
ncbi:MAG: ABC transporter substrate-binding protein [Candidatus Binatia bacterium]